MSTDKIRLTVWIGCLACYNGGSLVGDWYDADMADDITPDDLHGRETSHEELWVMDHDGFAGALKGECSPYEVAELARALADLTDHEIAPFSAWVEVFGEQTDWDGWVDDFRGAYRGFHESEAHFACERFEETASEEAKACATEWPFCEIDWNRAAEVLFTSEFHAEDAPGGVYVFDAD
ncbi:antirestriction protein ArdA [Streptomyces exfoliatus]|uniref:antirestriction protein ArdA n=1 Tax=Streptomyces exfoliatus TaxID=1905 RepID=UPI0037A75E4D